MSELENKKTLQLTFQKTIAEQDYYHLIRFYRADDSYFDIPLDYGLWPISEWPDDQLISFFYYPQKELKTYQLFRWQGTKKLGKIRQVVPDLIIEPISDKFNL